MIFHNDQQHGPKTHHRYILRERRSESMQLTSIVVEWGFRHLEDEKLNHEI